MTTNVKMAHKIIFDNYDPYALDFTWVTILVIRAFNCANLAPMMWGWLITNLVADLLLAIFFFFLALPKTLAVLLTFDI